MVDCTAANSTAIPAASGERDFGEDKGRADPRTQSPFGTFQLTDDGAWMMPYEILINPPAVESKTRRMTCCCSSSSYRAS